MAEVESKHDKFKRLATQRVPNAVKKIELLGHLSSSAYESTTEEVDKIIGALQQAVDGVKETFSKKTTQASKFQL